MERYTVLHETPAWPFLSLKLACTWAGALQHGNTLRVGAAGRGLRAGKCFRIGHMGDVTAQDMDAVLAALQQALPRLGFQPARVL